MCSCGENRFTQKKERGGRENTPSQCVTKSVFYNILSELHQSQAGFIRISNINSYLGIEVGTGCKVSSGLKCNRQVLNPRAF